MNNIAITAMEAEISRLKSKASHIASLLAAGRLYGKQKRDNIARRDQALAEAMKMQMEISRIRAEEDMKKSQDEEALDSLSRETTGAVLREKIETLRGKYMQFASDLTRVASMRMMASQFSQELTQVLEGLPVSSSFGQKHENSET